MRNKLLVAGTLALSNDLYYCIFQCVAPAIVKAASVSTVQTQATENVMTMFTAMQD